MDSKSKYFRQREYYCQEFGDACEEVRAAILDTMEPIILPILNSLTQFVNWISAIKKPSKKEG